MTENNGKDKNKSVIELSDIAVGTSREDEQIIELTEDLVDEARSAISGARFDTDDEASGIIELDEPVAEPIEPESEKIPVTDQQLEAAIERVVERKYGERIEALIDEVIRHKVTEEIETLKNLILKQGKGK
ncbi:MAG: hypothetical protein K9J85_01760 [Desulfobacteraceae bacterium]|nr:hypothetical protein [Desulfobacteraceae bacterium]